MTVKQTNPEINLHKYSQVVFDKGAKAIQWREKNSLSMKGAVRTDTHRQNQKLKKESRYKPYTLLHKMELRVDYPPKNQMQNHETLGDSTGEKPWNSWETAQENLGSLVYGDVFLDTTSKARPI